MRADFKKTKIAAPLILGLALFLAPNVTFAIGEGVLNALFDVSFGVVAKIFFGVAWIISALAGIAIAIEAWLLGFILQINTQIISSPPVAVGFPVALSIANLALVFAIVVIAIMTILRVQTYGVKQTLWKLIVIAIAINFGLVIAGVILQFFDSLSFYFLNSVNPAGGEGNQSGFGSFVDFSSALAGAFNPQKSFLGLQDNPANIEPGKLAASFGASIGSLITPITSLIFTIFTLIFIIITLGALIVMLIIRYVYIGYLLILLPLAWASWIFPATRSHWNKWWHNFFNQAAFAPIVLFFLWVAIQTSYAMNSSVDPYNFGSYYTSNSNPVWAAISEFFTNLFDPVVKQLLQMAVLLGVMIGGLFAAKSLGIKFADAAAGAAAGAAKGFGTWAARKGGGLAARAAARTMQRQAPTQYTGWRKVFNPINRATYALGTPIRAAAQRTAAGQRVATGLQTFGQRAQASPGLLASMWGGMGKGFGLWGMAKTWVCQNCLNNPATYPNPGVRRQKNMPTTADTCPVCGESTNSIRTATGNTAYQNWI